MTWPTLSPETESQGLTVRVESFVGPLDLLLHLCRTSEVDLANLPIRTITEQYLAHLEAVRFEDLETAGAFMVMAATLIYLKSKLLLPADPEAPPDILDEEGELLRQELAERLREYARVKALGVWLGEREAAQALLYGRSVGELPPPEDVPLEDLSVHLLHRAITRLIEEQKRRVPRQIEANPLSVLERMGEIIELLPKPVTVHDPVVRLRADLGDPNFSEMFLPPHFTNIQHGLRLARQVLGVQDTPNRQVILITDGLPTQGAKPPMFKKLVDTEDREDFMQKAVRSLGASVRT